MQVESLGEAIAAGWRVHARCLGGVVDYTRSRAKCHYQAELSLETLVWTRGRKHAARGFARSDDVSEMRESSGQSDFRAATSREARASRVGRHWR
jgi:hypothetical protein